MENLDYNFALERRLKEENEELSKRYRGCMSIFDRLLAKYVFNFPNYTDHSLIHSINVTNYSNMLLKDNVKHLNAEEIYVYLMAIALHDVGMTVSFKQFDGYMKDIGQSNYPIDNPDVPIDEITRRFHHEISAVFVGRYFEIFDIPSASYAKAIASVCRGHRKTDLYNEEEFSTKFEVEEGKFVNLSLLGALLRLADEMDLAQDRNPLIAYEFLKGNEDISFDVLKFKRAFIVKNVEVTEDTICITADFDRDVVMDSVKEEIKELQSKLDYCKEVIRNKSIINFNVGKTELKFI